MPPKPPLNDLFISYGPFDLAPSEDQDDAAADFDDFGALLGDDADLLGDLDDAGLKQPKRRAKKKERGLKGKQAGRNKGRANPYGDSEDADSVFVARTAGAHTAGKRGTTGFTRKKNSAQR